MGNIDVVLQNMGEIRRQLRNLQNMPEPVMQKVTNEFKQRAPGWIADAVRETYNIKKNEIMPKGTSTKPVRHAAGITVRGRTIRSISFIYKGRLLTPTHFGMTPKKPSKSGDYTLKVQVKKGQKKTLSKVKKNKSQDFAANFRRQGGHSSAKSPVMLMPTGGGGGVNYIPFQRVGQSRNALEVVKTISVPQMIDNPEVNGRIYSAINTNLSKRLQHYMDRYG